MDGIVFVVDSQWSMLSHNLESFQNLRTTWRRGRSRSTSPPSSSSTTSATCPASLSVEAMQESLGFEEFPFVESVAADAKGVVETFKLVSKLTFVHLLKRLQRSPDGEKLGPDWVAPSPPNSQSTTRVPPVSAQLLALTSTVGPAPAPPTDSPFETTGSWPGLAKGEVFGDATIPPFPIEPMVKQAAEPPAELPVEQPLEPVAEPEPESPATPDADDTLTERAPQPAAELEPLPEMDLGAVPEPEPGARTRTRARAGARTKARTRARAGARARARAGARGGA